MRQKITRDQVETAIKEFFGESIDLDGPKQSQHGPQAGWDASIVGGPKRGALIVLRGFTSNQAVLRAISDAI